MCSIGQHISRSLGTCLIGPAYPGQASHQVPKKMASRTRAWAPRPFPAQNSVPCLPAQLTRIQSADMEVEGAKVRHLRIFPREREQVSRQGLHLGTEAVLQAHLPGFKAKVQDRWSPYSPGQDLSCHRRGRARPRSVTSMSFSFSVPSPHVPMESVKGPELDGITCVSSLGPI